MIDLFKKKIDSTLETLIPECSSCYGSLYAGARYALLGPGKRIRPLLTLATAHMLCQNSIEIALIPACALELVHTYSLIHDDLPCMDNDDYRRGKPTLHRVYTEGHAVLIGDYLLTLAFELLATAPNICSDQKISLIKSLAQAAGKDGMVGGQIMDIECSDDIEKMHTYKTAALIATSVEFGGIIASISEEVLLRLRSFGLQFGKLFQMVDDYLDQDHPLGKETACQSAFIHYDASLKTLDDLPCDATSLKKLTQSVISQIHEN